MKYSKRTGTSFDDEKARRKDCNNSTSGAQFAALPLVKPVFNLRTQSSTHVPVLLLNQPILKIWDETICLALVVQIARRLANQAWLRGDCEDDFLVTRSEDDDGEENVKKASARAALRHLFVVTAQLCPENVLFYFIWRRFWIWKWLLRIHLQKNSNELEKKVNKWVTIIATKIEQKRTHFWATCSPCVVTVVGSFLKGH